MEITQGKWPLTSFSSEPKGCWTGLNHRSRSSRNLRVHYEELTYVCTMINKLITRFVYLTSLKVVTVTLSLLLGAPFFLLLSKDIHLILRVIHSLASGLMLSIPILAILHNMRQGNKFWRLLGEARDLLYEAQNLSDVNWIRNGHFVDLQKLLGEAGTREANLMQVAELHRLQLDIDWRNRELMGYYESK